MTTTTATTTPTFKVFISERCLREEFFVREKKEEKKKFQNFRVSIQLGFK